jgi:RNA polymerase sigma-70 factor (ECF subfamily)
MRIGPQDADNPRAPHDHRAGNSPADRDEGASDEVAPGGAGGETTEQLFEKAVAAHSRRLLAIARAIVGTRASPEDVVQQAVMNLFQHRHRYDWREPGGLLKRAVVNESLRLLRHPRMAMVAEEHPNNETTPVGGMIENETVRTVREAIAKLPDHFRAALVLCEYDNLSYAEIAQTLNASVPQVKTWIHRARRQLEAMLKGYVEEGRKLRSAKGRSEEDESKPAARRELKDQRGVGRG